MAEFKYDVSEFVMIRRGRFGGYLGVVESRWKNYEDHNLYKIRIEDADSSLYTEGELDKKIPFCPICDQRITHTGKVVSKHTYLGKICYGSCFPVVW